MPTKTNKFKITVTKKDIAKGWSGGFYNCPIALAIRRTVPIALAVKGISVGVHFLYIGERRYKLPLKAQDFSSTQCGIGLTFNKRQALKILKPFSFLLDLRKSTRARS